MCRSFDTSEHAPWLVKYLDPNGSAGGEERPRTFGVGFATVVFQTAYSHALCKAYDSITEIVSDALQSGQIVAPDAAGS